MEGKLISKKELLQRYGISYGALYRWKRMGLIPEEWFIKKATSTGQETFFDEETICRRVDRILGSKDRSSLEQLARELQPEKSVEPRLVIEASFEQKTYRISDIKSIRIEGKEILDLTELIAEKMQQML